MKTKLTQLDVIRASRKGSREAEIEVSTGWTAKHKVHTSKKTYSRKNMKIEY